MTAQTTRQIDKLANDTVTGAITGNGLEAGGLVGYNTGTITSESDSKLS